VALRESQGTLNRVPSALPEPYRIEEIERNITYKLYVIKYISRIEFKGRTKRIVHVHYLYLEEA